MSMNDLFKHERDKAQERAKKLRELLHGWRVKLERKIDKRGCCGSDYGVIHVRENAAKIWCSGCGHERGELEPRIVEWLLTLLAFHADVRKTSTPTIRNIDPDFVPLRPRDGAKVYRARIKRKGNQ